MKHSFKHWSRRTPRSPQVASVMTDLSTPAAAPEASSRCWIAAATALQSTSTFQSLLFSRWTAAASGTPLWRSITDRNSAVAGPRRKAGFGDFSPA